MEVKDRIATKLSGEARRVLERAKRSDRLRMVFVLDGGDGEEPAERPEDFESPVAYRKRLIERRRAASASRFGPVRTELVHLGLEVRGGALGRVVVVDGDVATLLKALEHPGVGKASLDEAISLPRPQRAR